MQQPVRIPGADVLQSIMEVYERGQTVEALRRAEAFAPLKEWRGAKPCVLAARLAANSGAPRLASRLSLRAWRTDRNDAEALAQYGYEILGYRGPLALWQMLRAWQEGGDGSAEYRAEVLALKGRAAADLRDFATAERLLGRAEAVDPHRAWIHLQRAYLLECQDQIDQALTVAKAASGLHPHPHYRPGVQSQAHLLQLLDRDDDAIQLLREADAVLQNGPVAVQLYALLSESDRWTEAEAALERFVTLSPLLEKPGRKWAAAQRARVAYHLGRRADAARYAALLDDRFHKNFAEKLGRAPESCERVHLPVTFVRQHFKTCAPATLAAIGRYWQRPAEHLKLAEAMCYDGTPAWQQRDWAEKNGWCVREFRVTQESAVALLEKGVPFALSTVEATSAHMMAAIGFDRPRGTLLLRDPGQPYVIETSAEEFLKRYRPFGPRGVVFLPEAERARIDGLLLPETELYDRFHRFWIALSKHDRAGAAVLLARMEQESPEAALTWEARLELASYDANNAEQARCLDKLLELFPNNPARLLARLSCLRDATREERIRFLEGVCNAKEADPALFIALARTLQGDARCVAQARRWLRRALRFRPMDTSAISALGDLLWDDGQLEEATELYRFAANIEGFREHLYQAWFIACRRTRRVEEAVTHLQDRFARFGSRSEQPALTLAWALRDLEQPARARQVLEEAIRLRPEDGAVLLRAASLVAGVGETADADRFLQAARGKVRENDWLRASAELAENRLDFDTVLNISRELLGREPLALDAHAGVARALARREGTTAALIELKKACAEFPHHYGLRRLVVDWSRENGPEAIEVAARELLRLEPSDAWARREVAMAVIRLQRGDEALREAVEAARIEPGNSYSFSILGHLHRQLGQSAEARAQYQRAVALSADNGDAIVALLDLARTDTERKDQLSFIERELIRQVVTGDGLLAYLEIARPILEPEALLRILRQAHGERPDLWHAWSALVSQLGHLGRLDEALALARGAAERFSHLPQTWLDLAMIHQWRNEPGEEIAAAERAFEMNPAWNRATLMLTSALERRDRLEDARRVYERALSHAPRDAQLHTSHAHLLWRQRRNIDAFAALERALRLAPGYDWAWELLSDWADQTGQPERTAAFARTLTEERPGEMRVWLMLARASKETDARLVAVERALKLDSRSTEAWDLKVEFLANAERFDEAIQVCTDADAVCPADVHILRGRRAWIEARRRHLPEAVRLIRGVLEDNASYVWGWHQLALWLMEQDAVAEATAALEQLQRLRPHDAWVNRQLGYLRLKQEDRPGAQRAFAAAFAAAPTDPGSAHNLLELQLGNSDLKGAAATLQVMQTHQPGAATLAAEIFLRLRRTPDHVPGETLEALCASPDPDPWPVDASAAALQRAHQTPDALGFFKRAIRSGACNPQVAPAAIRLLLDQGSALAATWLFLRLKPGELQRRAAAPLIQGLAAGKRSLLLRWLLWRRREVLFQDDAAWGHVGFALSNCNRLKQVVPWLSDWEKRSNVQPWMLFNYCLALRHTGRYDEAARVSRHVIETWGHREGAADLYLFLAVEEALAGSLPAAEAHLQRVVVRERTVYDQQMLALAKALVELQQVPRAERRRHFRSIRERLAPQFDAWGFLGSMRDVRRTFRRTGVVFFHQGAGPGAWLWFKWKLYWQWSLLPLAPLSLAIALQPPVLIGLFIWWLARDRKR
jgi:cellulose synthase operon protein C